MSLERGFEASRAPFKDTLAAARSLRAEGARLARETKSLLATIADVQSTLRDTLAALNVSWPAERAAMPPDAIEAPPSSHDANLASLAHHLGEDDFDGLTDAVIAAYKTAQATDDEAMEFALRGVLWQLGRRMAAQLGPKAAGVRLN